ncbi:Druantia anti-phage system protein DruA [Desertibaculum subflavum]|uniref:Druantia anti-phage system protein DruA n=1 Tax=Desertibaculum subflavum TaxID=2268458 RepID=UPI000E66D22C
MTQSRIIPALTSEAALKRNLRSHLKSLGFRMGEGAGLIASRSQKDDVRKLHIEQRRERITTNSEFLRGNFSRLIEHFANGWDVDPTKIRFSLKQIHAGTIESDLFRFASLSWSVPVSQGYGRRIRYLVLDEQNEKLAGIIALGDPVFNLRSRDNFICWSAKDRADRLVNMMDAYVLGAVPPYNMLLGGKAVACLVRSREVASDFANKYGSREGIISKVQKKAQLVAVTTSSALGRSSVYNRLKLNGRVYFRPIGTSEGWGHFHIPDKIFSMMREYLRVRDHSYPDQHRFGSGPNWRMRTIRESLKSLGLSEALLRHGVQREIFISCLAENALEILSQGHGEPNYGDLLTTTEISALAVNRWMEARARRRPEFRQWPRESFAQKISIELEGAVAAYAPL